MNQPHHIAHRTRWVAASGLAALAAALPAAAADLSFKLEPGVAVPLSAPQSDVYNAGASQSVKLLFGVTDFLDVGATVSVMLLPADIPNAGAGIGWGLGGGARLKRPHDAESFYGVSPWVDLNLLYMGTGELSRPAFDAGIGLSIPVGQSRAFWIGPFIRYLHILQSDDDLGAFDGRDAKLLSLGISLEVGSGIEADREPAPLHEHEMMATAPAAAVVACTPATCADADGDGLLDRVDRCPNVAGTAETFGCPKYQKLVIKENKLELTDRLYFGFDQATLDPASFPVLDEAADALKANTNFKVQIDGHSDSSGGEAHNQTLSEERAQAVRNYLVSRGVPASRLTWKGFSSSMPADTNRTAAGRDNNRRVEFVVAFIILDDTERAQ